MRIVLALMLLAAGACGGAVSSPSPTGTAVSPPPSGTASTATPTATPIVLPSFAQLSAPASDLAWMLVAGSRLFRSTDRGTTWYEYPLPSSARNLAMSFVSEREG